MHGIDVTDLDRKADPCNDFFEFSNGTWRANNPIPPSMTHWSKRWAAGEASKEQLKDILEAAAGDRNASKGSNEQIIGDYYAACMDESRANARGMEPLKPWFARIDAAKNVEELQHIMADMHDFMVNDPFVFGSQQDPHKPSWVLADIGASGLGLPDRDYYLKSEARFKEAREKYAVHIAAMFKLAGADDKTAAAAAQTIVAMETKLAEAWLEKAALRDPASTDHNTTFVQLQAMAPHIDWVEYFKHKRIPQDVDMNVEQPKFMQELDRQMNEESLANWKVYLKWRLLDDTAQYLSAAFVDENFAFNGKYLSGATENKPRWKRCAESTDEFLGDALGKSMWRNISRPKPKSAYRKWCATCCWRCAMTSSAGHG